MTPAASAGLRSLGTLLLYALVVSIAMFVLAAAARGDARKIRRNLLVASGAIFAFIQVGVVLYIIRAAAADDRAIFGLLTLLLSAATFVFAVFGLMRTAKVFKVTEEMALGARCTAIAASVAGAVLGVWQLRIGFS